MQRCPLRFVQKRHNTQNMRRRHSALNSALSTPSTLDSPFRSLFHSILFSKPPLSILHTFHCTCDPEHEGPKATTVTRMAASSCHSIVAADTLTRDEDTGIQQQQHYEDGCHQGSHPRDGDTSDTWRRHEGPKALNFPRLLKKKMESRSPFRIPRHYPTLAHGATLGVPLSRSPQGSGYKDGHPRRSSRVGTLTDTCEGFGITNATIFARVLDFWSWTPTLKVGNNLQGSWEKLFSLHVVYFGHCSTARPAGTIACPEKVLGVLC